MRRPSAPERLANALIWRPPERRAGVMHSPADAAALADVVRSAAADRRPLSIRGGGTRAGFGHAVDADVLGVSGLSGITRYEPDALTLVVGAGTSLREVRDTLAAQGQMLPFEPLELAALYGGDGSSTIGGMVATNASGPRRIQTGACRDAMIGVHFVDGAGRRISNGGRVMKNVTGYDLVKLMAGTHGTLGVLTEVAFKLLPTPEHAATVVLQDLDVALAIAALSAALGSPYNVSGAAHLPAGNGVPARTLVRIEGLFRSVDYRAAELVKVLSAFGTATIDDDPSSVAGCWRAIRDVHRLAAANGEGDVWRISVKPTDGVEVARRLDGSELQFDWGGGLVWARTAAGHDVRSALSGLAGHATLLRASPETLASLGAFQPEAAPIAVLGAGLRQRFDPAGILNPGRLGIVTVPAVDRAPVHDSDH